MGPFIANVLAGVVATAVFLLLTSAIQRMRVSLLVKSLYRVVFGEGIFYYSSRAKSFKDLGSVGNFVSSADSTLTYVGYWLASLEHSDLERELKALARRNVRVKLYLLDPRSPLLPYFGKLFSLSEDAMAEKIEASLTHLARMKHSLPDQYRENVTIRVHNSPINASIFVFDQGSKKSKIMIDHKLHTNPRSDSYGLVLYYSESALFKRVLATYGRAIQDSTLVEDSILEDDSTPDEDSPETALPLSPEKQESSEQS